MTAIIRIYDHSGTGVNDGYGYHQNAFSFCYWCRGNRFRRLSSECILILLLVQRKQISTAIIRMHSHSGTGAEETYFDGYHQNAFPFWYWCRGNRFRRLSSECIPILVLVQRKQISTAIIRMHSHSGTGAEETYFFDGYHQNAFPFWYWCRGNIFRRLSSECIPILVLV